MTFFFARGKKSASARENATSKPGEPKADAWMKRLILLGGDVERNPGPTQSAAAPRVPDGMSLRDAEAFFNAFPEAVDFTVTLLGGNKQSRGHFPSISRRDLLPMLPRLLEVSDGGTSSPDPFSPTSS